jgi:hypothetical protein
VRCKREKPRSEFYFRNKARGWRHSQCGECHREIRVNKWKEAREAVFDAYGGVCACCGEEDMRFLTLDHVFGLPDHHKGVHSRNTMAAYRDALPASDDFQLLCWNCNLGKAQYGTCPHKLGAMERVA